MHTLIERALPREEWLTREQAHHERADALTAAHRERSSRSEKHPVWDFLFTYYSYKPAQLRRWHREPMSSCRMRPNVSRGAGIRRARAKAAPCPTPDPSRRRRRTSPRSWSGCCAARRHAPASSAASACTSGRWCTRRTSTVTRCRCVWGRAGTDAVVESHDLRCTPLRRVPILHPGGGPPQSHAPEPRGPAAVRANRGVCTRGWTSTSGRRSSGPSSPANSSSTRSSWRVTSGCWTWKPRRTISRRGMSPPSASRRRRARRSMCAGSASSPNAAPHCAGLCWTRGSATAHEKRRLSITPPVRSRRRASIAPTPRTTGFVT